MNRCLFAVAAADICCCVRSSVVGDDVEDGDSMDASSYANLGTVSDIEDGDVSAGLSSRGCASYICTGDGVAVCICIAGICKRLGFCGCSDALAEGYWMSGGWRYCDGDGDGHPGADNDCDSRRGDMDISSPDYTFQDTQGWARAKEGIEGGRTIGSSAMTSSTRICPPSSTVVTGGGVLKPPCSEAGLSRRMLCVCDTQSCGVLRSRATDILGRPWEAGLVWKCGKEMGTLVSWPLDETLFCTDGPRCQELWSMQVL